LEKAAHGEKRTGKSALGKSALGKSALGKSALGESGTGGKRNIPSTVGCARER